MSEQGTPPPYQWSERTQWRVIAGLIVWGLVLILSGLLFLNTYYATTPVDRSGQPIPQSPQQVIPSQNHFPQKR